MELLKEILQIYMERREWFLELFGQHLLEDDKHLQVNYFCSNVVRNDTLKSHPGLEEAIMKLDNSITDKEMASLNYKVEVEGKEDVQVAKDYLLKLRELL